MKRLIVSVLALSALQTIQASDYDYLTIVETDGTRTSLTAVGLSITFSDGYIMANSTGNDGIDANGNLYIKGGNVFAIATTQPEVALDANTEGGYNLYISGGSDVSLSTYSSGGGMGGGGNNPGGGGPGGGGPGGGGPGR